MKFIKKNILIIFLCLFNFVKVFSQPDTINGLKIWLKADYGVAYDDNYRVSDWNDASGNGYIFSQSNLDKQPLYITSIDSMNHKPAIKFQNDELQCWQGISIGTIFALANYSHDVFQTYAGLLTRASHIEGEGGFILVGLINSTNFYYNASLLGNNLFINNEQTYNFSPLKRAKIICAYLGAPYLWNDMQIGHDRGFDNRFWDGNLFEVIIYDRTLNQNEIEQVKYYLKTKYNMDF